MSSSPETFQGLFVLVPPTSNMTGGKRVKRLKQEVADRIAELEYRHQFSENDRLFGRIIYFNHEKMAVRDIHNIVKPLFDMLEEKIIHDDKQICHFEGVRLDMEHNNEWFEVEYNLPVDQLQNILMQTC